MTNKVAERARALVTKPLGGELDSCMVCGRAMRPMGMARSEGRVCSPACARQWAQGL
ncbi:hypothetical protein [Saccharopolyspora hordei]|uniref:Uncharacterized protein n=1 Tax=Saccharopolyspora hordei TaxID=1838 RepID=A0A853AUU3_9PSEU|nr:hypothetical protein [Saccharopolyspora hordei]NYI86446.1 hypothetical protein [Saccharopolyspora hordei]